MLNNRSIAWILVVFLGAWLLKDLKRILEMSSTSFGSTVTNSSTNRATVSTRLPLDLHSQVAVDDSSSESPFNCSQHYKGVLRIEHVDENAAVGTLFFLYIVNHLIYAEQHDLLPLIHLGPNNPCYDENVHGTTNVSIAVQRGGSLVEGILHPRGSPHACHFRRRRIVSYPGAIHYNMSNAHSEVLTLRGNGIWSTYFQGPTAPHLHLEKCIAHLPLVELTVLDSLFGMHYCAPWAIRPWPLTRSPPGVLPPPNSTTLNDWYTPMRQRGARMVKRHFRTLPWLRDLVDQTNNSTTQCMAMHIRMTDKGHGRVKRPLSMFQPYAQAYSESQPDGIVYIATDDSRVLEEIARNWTTIKIRHQRNVQRSRGTEPIFYLYRNATHRSNTEALVDMYALSKCQVLVHGFSAMAEAALYINPSMRSINLDDPGVMTVEAFRKWLVLSTTNRNSTTTTTRTSNDTSS